MCTSINQPNNKIVISESRRSNGKHKIQSTQTLDTFTHPRPQCVHWVTDVSLGCCSLTEMIDRLECYLYIFVFVVTQKDIYRFKQDSGRKSLLCSFLSSNWTCLPPFCFPVAALLTLLSFCFASARCFSCVVVRSISFGFLRLVGGVKDGY